MDIRKTLSLIRKIFTSPRVFGRYLVYCLKHYRYNDLLQFAGEGATDKGLPGHSYVRAYDFFLRSRRDEDLRLCEIGLLRRQLRKKSVDEEHPDPPSLRMWRKYLPHAHLVGFDIRKCASTSDPKWVTIQGDQSSREDLQKIIDQYSEYDVIIDDALHASPHQQITLSFLFPHVKSGGIFFIEDLRHQPEEFEQLDVPKTRDLLRTLDMTGKWNSPLCTPEEKKVLETQVKEIHFFESLKGSDPIFGADALVAIVKK